MAKITDVTMTNSTYIPCLPEKGTCQGGTMKSGQEEIIEAEEKAWPDLTRPDPLEVCLIC